MSEIKNVRISNIDDLKGPWRVVIECDATSHERLKQAVADAAAAIARARTPKDWPAGQSAGMTHFVGLSGVPIGERHNWYVQLSTPLEQQIAYHEDEIRRLRAELGAEAGADDK